MYQENNILQFNNLDFVQVLDFPAWLYHELAINNPSGIEYPSRTTLPNLL